MVEQKQDVENFANLIAMQMTNTASYLKYFDEIAGSDRNAMTLAEMVEARGKVTKIGVQDFANYATGKGSTPASMFSQQLTGLMNDLYQDNSMADDKKILLIMKWQTHFVEIFNEIEILDNSFKDMLNRNIKGSISALLKSGNVDLLDIADNDKLMAKLDELFF